MKLKEVLDKTTQFFKDKKLDSPRLDAELLLAHGLKLQRIQLYLKFDQPLAEPELANLRELVRRRVAGEPVAYILESKDFYGHSFYVDKNVLIPRPETEHLVEEALSWAKDKDGSYSIVDLGAGSGCIGLSLLKALPQAKLVSVDLSEPALNVAKKNAEKLGLLERVQFVNTAAENTEAVTALAGKIDILVANPPYIARDDKDVEENVKKFEPDLALFADENGLSLLRNWSAKYAPHLSENSIVLMEMGMTQGPAMLEHFSSLKVFSKVDVIKDLSGLDRVIRGVKNG